MPFQNYNCGSQFEVNGAARRTKTMICEQNTHTHTDTNEQNENRENEELEETKRK